MTAFSFETRNHLRMRLIALAVLCLLLSSIPCRAQNRPPESADALIKGALKAYQSGQLDAAIRSLEQARAVAPDNSYVRLYLGLMLYEKDPSSAEAARLMESVLDRFPANPDLHLRLLDSRLRSKDGKGVVELIQRSQKPMESNLRLAFNMIYTLVRYDQLELARRELEKVSGRLQDAPANADTTSGQGRAEVYFIQGLISVGADRKEEALRLFQEADKLEFPPRNSFQMRILAEALFRLDEFNLSAQAYQVYLSQFPQDNDARLRLALAYLSRPSFARAEEQLRQLLRQAPEMPETNYYLGLVLLEEKKNDEARLCFESELKVDPGSYRAMAQLALLAYMEGDEEKCRLWLEKAAALNPEWVETKYVSGLLCNRQGKYEQAIADLENVVKQAPKHLRARYQLSIAYLRSGKEAKAKEHRDIYEQLMEDHKTKTLMEDARRK